MVPDPKPGGPGYDNGFGYGSGTGFGYGDNLSAFDAALEPNAYARQAEIIARYAKLWARPQENKGDAKTQESPDQLRAQQRKVLTELELDRAKDPVQARFDGLIFDDKKT
jgi:hypothetical protein